MGLSDQSKKAVYTKVMAIAVMTVAIASIGLLMLATDDSHALSGLGSETDPYILESEGDLASLSLYRDNYFKLVNDITVSNGWTPIGNAANPFRGHLDGNGHTITLGTVTQSQYTGFFGYLNGAEVKNLRILLGNSISPVTNTSPLYVGGLAGYITGSTIYNVSIDGAGINFNLSGTVHANAGGLAGFVSESNITYAFSKINVTIGGDSNGPTATPYSCVGGLIGYGENNIIDASLSECSVSLTVGKSEPIVGGFIGYTTGGSITRCGEAGSVWGENDFPSNTLYARVGGFAGYSNTPLEDVYSRSNVYYRVDKPNAQGGYIGGLVGESVSTINNAYSTGTVGTNLAEDKGGYFGGHLTGAGNAVNSYYNSDSAINPPSNHTVGTSLNDTQIRNINSFGPTWKEGQWLWNGGYPDLSVFTFAINVVIDPSSSYGTVLYSMNSPVSESSPVYTGLLTGRPWDTFHFQAMAAAGKVFLRWDGGDDPSVFRATTYVTVPVPPTAGPLGSRTVTAYFEDPSNAALLTVNAVPSGAGVFTFQVEGVDGAHDYTGPQYFAIGTEVSVTAIPTGTYSFTFWVANEDWSTNSETDLIELQDDMTLNAVFTRDTDPTLVLEAVPPGAGWFTFEIQGPSMSWIGPVSYSEQVKIPAGFNVRITAIPDSDNGYLPITSSGWGGAAGNTDTQNRRIISNMPANTTVNVTATFILGAVVTLTAVPEGGGTFTFSTDNGSSYSPRVGNKITVPIGSTLWVRATAEPGYTFGYWAGRAVGVDTISLTPTGNTSLNAYFYETDNSFDVTTTVVGAGNVTVTVGGVSSQAQSLGTRTIKVTAGDDVSITATDGPGDFMFYIGTVTTTERTIIIPDPVNNIPPIDKNYTETAYFTNGTPTSDLTVSIVGSGYAVIDVVGWPGSIDTRSFGPGPIPAIKVQVGSTVTVTAYGEGFFQNFIITDIGGTEYIHNPSFTRVISRDTSVTVNFTAATDIADVYMLAISVTSGNSIRYRIGGSAYPWMIYSSSDPYALYVDKGVVTEIGYIAGSGIFQHYLIDRDTTTAYSLPGPIETFADNKDHTVRAIFTDNQTNYYTLTVNVHGIGSIGLGIGSDPLETIVSTGTATRMIMPDLYKGFSITYFSGNLQYAVWTLNGANPVYNFGGGLPPQLSVYADNAQLLALGGQYVVDVYFLDYTTAPYELTLDVVGNGTMTFNISGRSENVPLTAMTGPVKIPLLPTDTVAINRIAGPGLFQFYAHKYDMPQVTDVILATTMTITQDKGNQAVTAHFTESSTPNTLTLGTYGSGYVTFAMRDIAGEYQSPSPGVNFNLPINSSDVVQVGYRADGGRFQFFMVDGAVQFQAPSPLAGDHVAIAYFTDTSDTFNLTLGVAGSGMIIAEIFDGASSYPSVVIEYSNTTQNRVIPLDMNDSASVRAREINGHFQYFTVAEGSGPRVAAQGTPLTSIEYSYPPPITGETAIMALFTDNKADDYQLNLNVAPIDKGTLTYQIGGDPMISFRGDTSPRTVWVDPYEGATIGYSDGGPNDGFFQYFVYERNGSAESMFSIPYFTGSPGDIYNITAKFTENKDDVVAHSLATVGDGYITFKHGTDPMGRYSSPGLIAGVPIPRILYVDITDTSGTIVNMEEYDILFPLYTGYTVDGIPFDEYPMDNVILDTAQGYSVVVYFTESFLVYTLVVNIHGGGTADILDGIDIPEEDEFGYIVHVYRDVDITAVNGSGLFQGMRVTVGGSSTWPLSPQYVIPSGSVASNTTVTVDIFFTESNDVYYLSLFTEAGGGITYNIDNTGVRSVGYQAADIPVDVGSIVDIGYYNSSGKFQYFKYGLFRSTGTPFYGELFNVFTIGVETAAPSAGDTVEITSYFTTTNTTYDLVVGTVGDGSVTFTEGRPGRQIEVVQGGPYTIPIDVTIAVTVGWQESNPNVTRFQYFEYTNNLSEVTLQRAELQIPGVLPGVQNGTYKAIAYFTTGQQYTLSISTNVSSGGAIGLVINEADPPLWYTGTAPLRVPVDLSTDVKVTYQETNAATTEFEFFVLNSVVTFPDDQDYLDIRDNVSLAANATVNVIAYFASRTNSYTVNLSTVGSGSITYTIDGYDMGSFNSEATPGRTSLEFRLNMGTSLIIGNSPEPDTKFMYYIYTVNVPPSQSVSWPGGSLSPLVSSYHDIVARFTGTDYYTLSLSATGGGAITYKIESDPMGSYSGFSAMQLYVDKGTDVDIWYQETTSTSKFRWFIQTIEGSTAAITRSSPLEPESAKYKNQTIEAAFIANPYYVTLETVGNGQITITIGLYDYTYQSETPGDSVRLPITGGTMDDPGTSATISYVVETGQHFQQFIYEIQGQPPVSRNTPFTISGMVGEEQFVTAYFTSGECYSIDLSRLGGGQITYTIGSRIPVNVSNTPASPFRLYVDVTDEVVIGKAAGSFAFQYYNYRGDLFSEGPLTYSELTFPADTTTGSHSVTAVFTSTPNTYEVTLGTVGNGYITFRLSTMGPGEVAKYQSVGTDTYTLTVDTTEGVTVGHIEDELGDGYFIGYMQGNQPTLIITATLNVDINTAVPNRTITAYFTSDKTNVYTLILSTIGNGNITYEYRDLGVTGQFRSVAGSTRTVYADITDEVTVGHTRNAGEYFNVFIEDGIQVFEDTIVYSPSSPETHEVTAVFTNSSTVYEIALATTGSGYITFVVPGVFSGKYSGPEWSVYVDRTNSISIGNEPDGSFFQYYEIAVGANAPTIDFRETFSVPAGTIQPRLVTARFTADDTNIYTLNLSTLGNGYITFSLDGGPTGQFMSSTATPEYVLHVDNGVTTTIDRFVSGSTGRFQFFVHNDTLTTARPLSITADAVIEANFTNALGTYSLTLATVGVGGVYFELNSKERYTETTLTFQVDNGTAVPVRAVEKTEPGSGAFRFIVYDGVTHMTNELSVRETGGTHVLTTYFTADLATTTYLTVGKTGTGRVSVSIVTGGVTIPTIADFTGIIPMEQTDSVRLNAFETVSTEKFVNWTSDNSGIDGLAAPIASFGMAISTTVTANFAPAAGLWKLTLAATEGGSASFSYSGGWGSVAAYVSQDFNIPKGSQVDLTSSATAGYVHTGWTSNDPLVSIASPAVSFEITKDTTATAVFYAEGDVWTLTLSAGTGGTASFGYGTGASRMTGGPVAAGPSEDFFIPKDIPVDLIASADTGHAFIYWTSINNTDIDGVANSTVTFSTDTNTAAEAVFDELGNVSKFTLSAGNGGAASFSYDSGASTITGSAAEGTSEIFYVPNNSSVDLTASPAAGNEFTNWIIEGLEINSLARPELSFEITNETTAAARFAAATSLWRLTLSAGTGGSASFGYGSGASRVTDYVDAGLSEGFFIPKNVPVDLMASAEAGYAFIHWASIDNADIDNIANSTVTFSTDTDTTAEAVFDDEDKVWKLTLSTTTGGSASFGYDEVKGHVAANDSQVFFVPKEPEPLVSFAAAPSSTSYRFDQWAEDAAGESITFSILRSEDYNATAIFAAVNSSGRSYTITATSDDGSTINPSGSVSVPSRSDRTFVFSAMTGYQISAVYVDSVALSSEQVASGLYTFTNVNSNHVIEVVSGPRVILLVVDVEGGNGIPEYRVRSSDQNSRFERSQQIVLRTDLPDLYVTIAVGEGYKFVEWTGDVESDEIELHFFNADHDIYLIAHLTSDGGAGEWAIVNLICAILAMLIGAFAVVAGRERWKKDKEGLSKATILRITALAIGTFSLVIFFITEDLTLSIGLVDKWTPLAIGLFVVALIVVALSYWRYDKD